MIQPLLLTFLRVRCMVLSVFLLLCIPVVSAQQKVVPITQFQQQLLPEKAERLRQLTRDLQPAVYISATGINHHGESPVCIFAEQMAQQRLSDNGFDKTAVELVSIVVSEPGTAIHLDHLSDYPSLQYLLLRLPSAQSVQTLQFTGAKPGLAVLYDVQVSY